MVKFLVIRHGYSKSNEQGLFTGRTDVPLADTGIIQARKTARLIADNYRVDAIYSSPLLRALQTAEPLSRELGLPVVICDDLCEIDGGEWEQKPASSLLSLYPEDYGLWLSDIGLSRCTGGESMRDVQQRALKALTAIASENDGKTVAVVTHAGVIRALQCAWQHIPLDRMKSVPWVPNASLSVAEYENGAFSALFMGDDRHLSDISTNLPKNI